jgi:hypothetical protein
LAEEPAVVLRGREEGLLVPAGGLERGGEAALAPLVQHFTALQQHMFDQFQQTMVMLVRMLSSMHEQQVSLIRDELRQFQKATEELQRLQQQLGEARAPAAPAPVSPPDGRLAGAGPRPQPAPAEVPAPAGWLRQPEAVAGQEGVTGDGVHAWLNQRIAEVQSERQSSWQRILGFLRGP